MSREQDNETAVGLADPLVGSIFDKRFRVEQRIAAGGFGAIYRATHVKSSHPIALKVLHPTLASDLGVLARFRREGTTLTSLRNAHTITAYEFGQADRTLFIVLELLHGVTLYDHYSDHGPLEWKRVVHIAQQVCESLEEAHAQGIVHRDLKPTNIHLENIDGDPDFVKVLDFGIAKIVQGSDHDSGDITNVGQMIGTLDYMSPEQMVGGQVTGQTDIYTLGIVMYEMIAGTRPFPESATAGAALAAMLKTTPEPLYLRAPVPRPLDAIVMRCLERETSKRYRNVSELRADLEGVMAGITQGNTATVQIDSGQRAALDEDATAITPPPEKILDSLRTASRGVPASDSSETAPRAKHSANSLFDTMPRGSQLPEWGDDDEHAPTTTRQPEGYSRPPSSPLEPLRPTPRPLASRHDAPAVPQLVVAPFSTSAPRVRPATAPPLRSPQDRALGVAPTALALPAVGANLFAGVVPAPAATSASGPHANTPGRAKPATLPPMSMPPLSPPIPGAPPGNTPISMTTTAPGHAPAPRVLPPTPPPHSLPQTPVPTFIPPTPPIGGMPGHGGARVPTASFDMGQLAARDETVRRVVWIVVLVLAAAVGFLIATQL